MLASVHVFTFKAGWLASLAHDLQLSVQDFQIVLERGVVSAWFAADSLQVDGVMAAGVLDSKTLLESDKQQISAAARDEILQARRFPRIEFQGQLSSVTASTCAAEGVLRVRGQQRTLRIEGRRDGDKGEWLRAQVELTPSTFGITPYKALAGAIRLQDRVLVTTALRVGDWGATLSSGAQTARFCPKVLA
jgi:hypothetical protein